MFAAQTFGVTPDMICVGKGLSSGYTPLAALLCRQHVADAFWGDVTSNPGFVEGHTFEGNPLGAVAGREDLAAALAVSRRSRLRCRKSW